MLDITKITITVKELCDRYEERGPQGLDGVYAYGGRLTVRPAYQREFIYADKERDEVIRTVKKGFPINIMYWSKVGEDKYELMDGQQRTISLGRYVALNQYSVDYLTFRNLLPDKQEEIEKYKIDVYVCEGKPTEILEWFKVINIAGKPLKPQELRNISYTGTWLTDAKLYFSKPGCLAYKVGKNYVSGAPLRQEILETALEWICDKEGLKKPEEYMSIHQHDNNANALKMYYKRVIEWVEAVFPNTRPKMKEVNWGYLYNRHKDDELDPAKLEKEIQRLILDDDVTNKAGVYEFVLSGNENALNIRAFSDSMKIAAYERQEGICPKCKKHFEYNEMHGDHHTPWSKGGHTTADNCVMLCAECNRDKWNV